MTLTRRKFINRLGLGAGASLFIPFLDRVVPLANADGNEARRIIFYQAGLGIRGEQRVFAEADGNLNMAAFSALDAYKDDFTVVNNMYHPYNHHLHGSFHFLTVARGIGEDRKRLTPGGISIDRAIAKEIGGNDPISSVTLNPTYRYKSPSTSRYYTSPSADGPDMVYPSEPNPVAAYASLFGEMSPTANADELAARLSQRKSVLDFVTADIGRLNGRLGAPERVHLERYADSIRGLENKLTDLAAVSCDDVSPPDASLDDDFEGDVVPEVIDAHIEIGIHALACGITKVLTFAFNSGGLGFLGVGGHSMWHGGPDADHNTYYNYHAERWAYIWEKLKTFPQGASSIADNSMMVWINSTGGGHHNSSFRSFVMTLGSCGGAFETGRFISLPDSEVRQGDRRRVSGSEVIPSVGSDCAHHCVSDFYVSAAQAVGASLDTFGDPDQCMGALPQMT